MPLLIPLVDVAPEDAVDDEPTPLQHVNAEILREVLQWCTRHKDDVHQHDGDGNRGASNGRHIWLGSRISAKGLLDRCCKSVASMIKGTRLEETSRTFKI
ncbi:S-phase kinase-associated protein 1, partial [Taenia solium]